MCDLNLKILGGIRLGENMQSYHYVPVLRWKKGELDALKDLEPLRRNSIMPLIQPVGYDLHPELIKVPIEKMSERYFELMGKKVDALYKSWGQNPIFVDGEYLEVLGRLIDTKYMVDVMLYHCREKGIPVVPITGLGRSPLYQESIQSNIRIDSNGTAIRTNINELSNGSFSSQLMSLMRTNYVSPSNVDIILDLGLMHKAENQVDISQFLPLIPLLHEWRSLIMIGGSFPKDLGGLSLGRNKVPRIDLNYWQNSVKISPNIGRIPTYGDHATQHPVIGPIVNFPPSASIRYASEGYWLVMKGQAPSRRAPGEAKHSHQYCGHCVLLVGLPEYSGPHYSAADKFIFDKQYDYEHPGSTTNWVSVGVGRHIAMSIDQVSKVVGVPAVSVDKVAI
ncbi:hypothetical protein ACFL6E_07505 [Candidatus Neomarinimicrobiota bacterium]